MIDIKISHIRVGNQLLIEGVNIHTDGRRLRIKGRSGSGKTSIAKLIAGDFEESTAYEIDCDIKLAKNHIIRRPDGLGSLTQLESRVGYIPNLPTPFFMAPSVLGEVQLTAHCSSTGFDEAKTVIDRWVKESPLLPQKHLSPILLSGGQQRLLIVETVILSGPGIIVMDGGVSSLDPLFRSRVKKLIQEWLSQTDESVFIYISDTNEMDWFPFDHEVCLTKSENNNKDRITFHKKPIRSDTNNRSVVCEYEAVTAGPYVKGHYLLQNLAFEVREGEYVGLAGDNGSGKTTILRLLCGVLRPHKGKILFNGKSIWKEKWPGINNGVAYLPQEPEIVGPGLLSIDEQKEFSNNVVLSNEWVNWSSILEIDWNGDPAEYWTMSSSERARAAILSQVLFSPALWMFDEPTTRIDSNIFESLISEVRNNSINSGIIVSHDHGLLERCVDRILFLKDGKIVD